MHLNPSAKGILAFHSIKMQQLLLEIKPTSSSLAARLNSFLTSANIP